MAYGEAVENLSREMVLVSHIQRGAVQDGPGWRTTVYLKGCPLRCPWCYNAESLHFQQELRYVPQFCIGAAACGRCLEVCRSGGIVPPGPDTDGRPVVRRQLCPDILFSFTFRRSSLLRLLSQNTVLHPSQVRLFRLFLL